MNNPYTAYRRYEAGQEPPPLVGRSSLLIELLSTLSDSLPRSIQLVAFRTMGTTSILRYLAHPQGALAQADLTNRLPVNKRLLPIYFDFNRFPDKTGIAGWLWEAMSQREELRPFIPPEKPLNLITTMKQVILKASDDGWRLIFLCDHFDRTLSQLKVSEATALRPLVELAGFVTATERPLVLIKPDAASSLFGSQIHPVDLLPLAYREARTLLENASQALPNGEPAEIRIDFGALLRLTGTIPHYVLRGAELWYNACHQFKALNELSPQELGEILRPTLLQDFTLEFVRFWNHISVEQQRSLSDLIATNSSLTELPLLHKRRLHGLVSRGLVVMIDGRYQPMSELWADFIRQKSDETKTAQEDAAVTGEAGIKEATPREAEVLAYLQEYANQICPYETILTNVWRDDDTAENRHILRQVIAQLRRRLAQTGAGTIINHRNKGYEFREER